LSSTKDEWEAYKQRMAVRHCMENAGEAHLKANPSSQVSTALFGPTKAIANPPPSVDGIVWLDGGVWIDDRQKIPGENQTGHKRLVAFEGEVLDGHGLPRLWRFAEDKERLLQLRPLLVEALEYATKFYQDGDRDWQTVPLGVRGATVQTCQRLLPIPVGWAHQFLDNPPMGVAYRRMLQLMTVVADMANRHLFQAFGNGVALACGSPDPMAPNPVSAADSL